MVTASWTSLPTVALFVPEFGQLGMGLRAEVGPRVERWGQRTFLVRQGLPLPRPFPFRYPVLCVMVFGLAFFGLNYLCWCSLGCSDGDGRRDRTRRTGRQRAS